MTLQARLRAQLEFLYPGEGDRWLTDLVKLMQAHNGPQAATTDPSTRLDQDESVLITYADSIQSPGEAPLQTLQRFLRAHAAGVVRTVHLLPFYPWTSDDGFSVVDDRAVDPAVGSWDDVANLRHDAALMFDAVLNHASSQSRAFQGFLAGDPAFEDFFVTADPAADLTMVVRPRTSPLLTQFEAARGTVHVWTTFSADQVDRNYANPRVLLDLIDILLGYIQRGASILRLDAITYLWKEVGTSCVHLPKTHGVLRLIRTVVDATYPNAVLLTETNVPHHENVSYFGDGHDEASMVYNFALPPLTLHTFATGDSRALSQWAADLQTPSKATTFFNFLASHDGIGVRPVESILSEAQVAHMVDRVSAHGGLVSYRAMGSSKRPYELNISLFDALSNPTLTETNVAIERFITAHAIMYALAGVPATYIHSLLGSRNDHANVERLGYPRAINRSKLDLSALERELADPHHRRSLVLQRLSHALRVRRAEPCFHPQAAQKVLDLGPGLFAILRRSATGTVLGVHDVAGSGYQTSHRELATLAGASGPLVDLLGGGVVHEGEQVRLQPFKAAWWKTNLNR